MTQERSFVYVPTTGVYPSSAFRSSRFIGWQIWKTAGDGVPPFIRVPGHSSWGSPRSYCAAASLAGGVPPSRRLESREEGWRPVQPKYRLRSMGNGIAPTGKSRHENRGRRLVGSEEKAEQCHHFVVPHGRAKLLCPKRHVPLKMNRHATVTSEAAPRLYPLFVNHVFKIFRADLSLADIEAFPLISQPGLLFRIPPFHLIWVQAV